MTPAAVPVSYAQLASGDYESMYVALDVQVVVSDLNKLLSDNVTVQTVDDERFVLCARQASTFGIDAVPVGSGRLCGIAGIYEGAYAGDALVRGVTSRCPHPVSTEASRCPMYFRL